jgi:hypothetical protein
LPFDSKAYGDKVATILALHESGYRLIPLISSGCSSQAARERLRKHSASDLFSDARAAHEALSGLWLYFSAFTECHEIVQDLNSQEASFWHAILHRQEPDSANASYWFRQVGTHPVFPCLNAAAQDILAGHPNVGFKVAGKWDPFSFIGFCEQAREKPGFSAESAALEIQRAEWQLLFDYCARPRS